MTAAIDRRTEILARLVALLSNITIPLLGDKLNGPISITPDKFVHNRGELPAEKVAGIALLDADETKDPRTPSNQGRAGPVAPSLMRMSPEIYIVLNVRKPDNANVGEDLSTARAAVLNLILNDDELSRLVGANGQIIYDSCVTDLARNRTMRGQMGLVITFVYPFYPQGLVGA